MADSRRNRSMFIAALILLLVIPCAAVEGASDVWSQAGLCGGWQPGPDTYHPNKVIVRFSDTITTNAATNSIERLGYSMYRVADFKATATFPSGAKFGIVELPERVSPESAISRLSNAPGILYAERDYICYKDQAHTGAPIVPNDTYFERMWGLHNEDCQVQGPRDVGRSRQ